jgi:nicotinamide mononucleotide transporter
MTIKRCMQLPPESRRRLIEVVVGGVPSLALVLSAVNGWLPITVTEALGSVTGAACVYLVLRESVWNFPVGIANNLVFLALFYHARLYGDAGLQVVYLALAAHGWWSWLHGGREYAPLRIRTVGLREAIGVAVATAMSIPLLMYGLIAAGAAAPVLDSTTTMLSIAAQHLLNRKFIQNWYLWIAADILYVYLYIQRELYLTAALYGVFLLMCLYGLREWKRIVANDRSSSYEDAGSRQLESTTVPT